MERTEHLQSQQGVCILQCTTVRTGTEFIKKLK